METISFPRVWKKHWGFQSAAVLSYLLDHEQQEEWFSVPLSAMRADLDIHPSSLGTARLRLMAAGVLDVQMQGARYLYRINHDRLDSITNEQEG